MKTIRDAGVKLPADYLFAARSMTNVPRHRHLDRMRTLAPHDFERIKLLFPLIEAELARLEFRAEKYERAQKGPQPKRAPE